MFSVKYAYGISSMVLWGEYIARAELSLEEALKPDSVLPEQCRKKSGYGTMFILRYPTEYAPLVGMGINLVECWVSINKVFWERNMDQDSYQTCSVLTFFFHQVISHLVCSRLARGPDMPFESRRGSTVLTVICPFLHQHHHHQSSS